MFWRSFGGEFLNSCDRNVHRDYKPTAVVPLELFLSSDNHCYVRGIRGMKVQVAAESGGARASTKTSATTSTKTSAS